MKNFIKISAALIVVIIAALFVIPYFYKDKIVDYIKQDINKTLNARVDFKEVNLSLFKNFPHFSLGINEVSVVGINTFENVNLVNLKKTNIVLDLISVITSKPIEVRKFVLSDGSINIIVSKDGQANYDIIKPSTSTPTETSSGGNSSSQFNLKLKGYTLDNIDVSYIDQTSDILFLAKKIKHNGKGALSNEAFLLETDTQIDTLTVQYGDIAFLNRVKFNLEAELDVEDNYAKYTLKDTKASVNELTLNMQGFVKMLDKAIDIDMSFETDKASIVDILSLVPKAYLPDFNGVKTNGVAKLIGSVKGQNSEEQIPGFNLNVLMQNGTISYPDLPKKVENINILTNIDFKGGKDLNTMVVDIPKIRFNIVGSQFDGRLNLKNILKDPWLNTAFKANLDFSDVKKALKYDQIKSLKGLLNANVNVTASMSAITNQDVNNIKADGFIKLNDFVFESATYNQPVEITKALVNLSPTQLNIDEFKALIGKNDFRIKGAVSNYLAYTMGEDKVIKGIVDLSSSHINLNDFMTDEVQTTQKVDQETTKTKSTEEGEAAIVKIPKNLDMTVNAQVAEVLYKKLILKNAKATLRIANQKAEILDGSMNMLDGKLLLSGVYDTSTEHPKSKLNLGIEKMDVREGVKTFDSFVSYAPILNKLTGIFNSDLNMEVELDNQMNPVLESINAIGHFKTEKVAAQDVAALTKLSSVLKVKSLASPQLENISASFKIKDGKLELMPNTFKINNMSAEIKGSIDLNQNLDFEMGLDIPKKMLGADINKWMQQISGTISKLNLNVDKGSEIQTKFHISGTATNPKIKPLLFGEKGSIKEQAKEIVKQHLDNVKNEALQKAKAKADKLIATAEAQKDKLVAEAQKLADQTVRQAKAAADKLMKEAGNNPLKKMAVKTAADKINKEAKNKAQKIIDKAKAEGDKLVNKAKQESNDILKTL